MRISLKIYGSKGYKKGVNNRPVFLSLGLQWPEKEEMAFQATPVSAKTGKATPSHQLIGMRAINGMRQERLLCDVVLKVQGRSFPAHRVVLSAFSQFFRLMFTTKMKEVSDFEVELKDVEPEIIEQLIEYIYTARISVNTSNVQSLLFAADLYQMDPVKTMCLDFLKERLNVANCLGMSALADWTHSAELKAAADRIILRQFPKVVKSEEFLQLDVARLTNILRQDKVVVCDEEQVYDAAISWLKHDLPNRQQFLEEVLSCVRFPLISRTFLSKTVQAEPLVQNNANCLHMFICGMRYHLLSWKDHKEKAEMCRPRWKKRTHRIALIKTSMPPLCRFFNFENASWTRFSFSFDGRQNAAIAYWDGIIYLLGGSSIRGLMKSISCYNIQQDHWFSTSELPTPSNYLASCASQGNIYTSGGFTEEELCLSTFQCFNTQTKTWQSQPNMLIARCCHGSVEVNGLVYVCGGAKHNKLPHSAISGCEVFDPSTQQWTELCAMNQPRMNHGLVVVNNRIYAIGGQGQPGFLRSMEYYDIASNEWHKASSMPFPMLVKCVAVGNFIYVMAGKCQERDLQYVLEYHTERNKWVTSYKVNPFLYDDSLICVVDA